MDIYNYTESKTRSSGALEIALRARDQERKQASLLAEIRAETAAGQEMKARSRGLISRLLSSLGLF